MPSTDAPAQSFPVFGGRDFRVASGANLGDGLSYADDIVLDDVYRLHPGAQAARLSLRADGAHFRITDQTGLGTADARVCLDCALTLMTPDGQTTDALILVQLDAADCVEHSFLLPLAPLAMQADYAVVGIDRESARQKLAQIACVSFTRSTHITLSDGTQRLIEDLRPGDRVLTRDNGARPVRWIGQSTVRATGQFAPIRIRAGVLNNINDLVVSPDHRLFIHQRSDEIGAGQSDLLVKARHLVNGQTITVETGGFVDYFQLLFDTHQIVFAEGIAAESFLIDPRTAPALPQELSERLSTDPETGAGLSGLDVSRHLLDRPDAAELLRRASTR